MIFRCSSQTARLEEAVINQRQSLDAEGISEIQPATPHEPDQPRKLKQDAQTQILSASRQTEVLQCQAGQWEHNLTDTQNSAGMSPKFPTISRGEKAIRHSNIQFFFPITEESRPRKIQLKILSKKTSLRFPTMRQPCITYPLLTASSSFQGCFLQEKSEGSCLKKLN